MTTTTINSWGDVKQKLFFNGKEIVKVNKRVTPNKGATLMNYTKKDGETIQFVYADQATIIDTEQARELAKQERELFKLYKSHEIGLDQYAKALAELAQK